MELYRQCVIVIVTCSWVAAALASVALGIGIMIWMGKGVRGEGGIAS